MRRWSAAPLVAAALFAASVAAAPASPAPRAAPPSLDATAWLLIDADDEQRLAAQAPSRPLPIASATKLMTAYLALEELPLKRELTAPTYQALPAESILGLREGERVSVRDLLYSLILASANDSAVTIAQGAAGSVDAFVAEMNDAAQQLGLNDTGYTNPIGLDDPGNRSSARDLVTLAEKLMENKLFRRIADTTEATIHTDQRTIEIMTRDTLLLSDPSVTGIKTGHTLDAGYVLVGSATREGVDLISVVLGAPSEAARDSETEQLLDYGFSLYRPRTPVRRGEAIVHPELAYQDETLGLAAARTLSVSVRRGQQLATEVDAPDEVVGPIEKGERLGTVTVTVDGSEVDSAPLVATRAAEAATFSQKLRSRFPLAGAVAVVAFVVILIGVVLVRHRSGASRTTEERMRSREQRTRRKGDESL